eukprot:GHVO01006962.1.p1 GENE.GHVO01006962.1~~GHVO01006962.1.p1  ORF type:complete len:181 (+),score=21.23 GHVO01006962.1:34-543(+)
MDVFDAPELEPPDWGDKVKTCESILNPRNPHYMPKKMFNGEWLAKDDKLENEEYCLTQMLPLQYTCSVTPDISIFNFFADFGNGPDGTATDPQYKDCFPVAIKFTVNVGDGFLNSVTGQETFNYTNMDMNVYKPAEASEAEGLNELSSIGVTYVLPPFRSDDTILLQLL